jgi:dTMP kinase
MAADRAQHMTEVVRPALAAGRDVVSDRSALSSLAYQGYGRGLSVPELRYLSDWAGAGRWPDLVVLIDVAPEEMGDRLAAAGRTPDRFEAAGSGFHDRVRRGFAALAAAEPQRWAVVDGGGTPDEVADRVLKAWTTFEAGWRAEPGG